MLEQINAIESASTSKCEGLSWEKWQEAEKWMDNIEYMKREQVEGLSKYLEIKGELPKIAGTDHSDGQQLREKIDKMWSSGKIDPDFDHFYAEYNEKFDPDNHLTHRCRFRRDNMMYRKDLPAGTVENFYNNREWEKVD